ncbi:MAG: acyltransferase [Bacteroidota bacterium]
MKSVSFIPSLTPLRGIAAMLVALFHFSIFLAPLASPGNFIISKWYLMVDLFFVLSGFIMYHVYGSWFQESIARQSFGKYMRARFARLYPLHLFTLLVTIGIALVLYQSMPAGSIPPLVGSVFDPAAIPTSLLLVQAWGFHLEAPWNTPAWSISVEWFLYLLFPFLIAFLVRAPKIARPILWSLAIGGLILIMYVIQPYMEGLWDAARGIPEGMLRPTNTIDLITGPALLRGFCSFTIGMLLYERYRQGWQKPLLSKGFWFPLLWAVMLGLWMGDWLPDVLAVLMFATMILHLTWVEGSVKNVLNNKVFTYLGDISYSIYMVHVPILLSLFVYNMIQSAGEEGFAALDGPAPEINLGLNWLMGMAFLAVVILVASFTYRLIEKPLRRKLNPRKKEATVTEQVAA